MGWQVLQVSRQRYFAEGLERDYLVLVMGGPSASWVPRLLFCWGQGNGDGGTRKKRRMRQRKRVRFPADAGQALEIRFGWQEELVYYYGGGWTFKKGIDDELWRVCSELRSSNR